MIWDANRALVFASTLSCKSASPHQRFTCTGQGLYYISAPGTAAWVRSGAAAMGLWQMLILQCVCVHCGYDACLEFMCVSTVTDADDKGIIILLAY